MEWQFPKPSVVHGHQDLSRRTPHETRSDEHGCVDRKPCPFPGSQGGLVRSQPSRTLQVALLFRQIPPSQSHGARPATGGSATQQKGLPYSHPPVVKESAL